jgi:hypothetical protein
MAVSPCAIAVQFSSFYARAQDGLSRMMEFIETDQFQLVVNGEAVLISLRFHEVLQANRSCHHFEVGDAISPKDYGVFLEFVRPGI